MTESIKIFAESYRLRVTRDDCGDSYIVGKAGLIYGSVGLRLIVTITGGPNASRWNRAKRRSLAAGFELWQDGDDEGSVLFDPDIPVHAKLAIRLVGCRQRRIATPAQRVALARHAFQSKTPRASGSMRPLESTNAA
jgi:hypothetical protein